MIVVDAGVLAVALVDDAADGQRARDRLRGERLAAPDLVDLETLSVLRGLVLAGTITPDRAQLAVADLRAIPIDRATHRARVTRCWELRNNLTIYDAAYVALAEALDVPLITGDGRLAKANGPRCAIEMLAVAN